MSRPPRLTTGRIAALVIGIPISLAVIAWGALTVVALVSLDSFQIHRSFSPSASQAECRRQPRRSHAHGEP